jgi:hypothetical protein
MNAKDFTFEELSGVTFPSSMAYIVGLVDSSEHPISDPLIAKRILQYLFDIEEQASDASELLEHQQRFASRYFQGGYQPKTPCMLTKRWSPIAALLETGAEPVALKKEDRIRATASGIWRPDHIFKTPFKVPECKTFQELFWAVLSETFRLAQQQQQFVSVIAQVGFNHDTQTQSLPAWTDGEVLRSGRLLWQRAPS